MKDQRNAELGAAGERAAAHYLEGLGWRLLARRWRCRFGEIDLIGRDGSTTVFVEVKTRSGSFDAPEASVDARKRRRIVLTALSYLEASGAVEGSFRFDVVAVEGARLRHLRDAFTAEGLTL